MSERWIAELSPWRKSTYCSGADSTCVEVAVGRTGVAVRDSKDPGGGVLRFTLDEWWSFVFGVRNGEFEPGRAGAGDQPS
jgi:hypothetical protein